MQRLPQLFGLHGIGQTDPAQDLGSEVRHALEIEILTFRQRVANTQRSVIGYADYVACVGFLGERSILGKEKLRSVEADDFPRSYLLDLHAARKLAGAKPHEGNTVPMIRVHIRLNLENER